MKKIVALVFLCTALTACSSSGILTVKQPMVEKIPPDRTVSLSIDIVKGKETEEDFITVKSRIGEKIYARLLAEGIFRSVFRAPQPADYTLDLVITGARVVSGAARVWGGVMAGHNNAQLDVTLTESATRKTVAVFNVDGMSASHPFSSENSLDDALREAVEDIVDVLKGVPVQDNKTGTQPG